MTIYADETYYTDSYLLGKAAVIDTAAFSYYARKASLIMDRYTYERLENSVYADTETVKTCCCELAENIYQYETEAEENKNVASEKTGDYSVTYADKTSNKATHNTEIRQILTLYLAQTGLLYSGVV